jgi:hypothetical protein
MPRGGFEPTIPMFERSKTVRLLEPAILIISRHATKYSEHKRGRVHVDVYRLSREKG